MPTNCSSGKIMMSRLTAQRRAWLYSQEPYLCRICAFWHLASRRVNGKKKKINPKTVKKKRKKLDRKTTKKRSRKVNRRTSLEYRERRSRLS